MENSSLDIEGKELCTKKKRISLQTYYCINKLLITCTKTYTKCALCNVRIRMSGERVAGGIMILLIISKPPANPAIILMPQNAS